MPTGVGDMCHRRGRAEALRLRPESRQSACRIIRQWRIYSQGVAAGALDRPLFLLGSLAVESVVLMKSELTPTGSVYTKLWDVRLRG